MKHCAIWISLDPRSYGTWLVPYSASKCLLAVLWIRILALVLVFGSGFFCADPDPDQSGANLLDWPPQIPAFHFDMDQNPAFHFEADPDPAFPFGTDPACYFDADPDPQPLLAVC
jgi:hypothetical protein